MALARIRHNLSREVLALCLIIFFADVLSGIISPTFSLYATGLGVSVAIIGVLNTLGGLTTLVASLPVGMLSDRIGRQWVMIGGMAAFSLAMVAFALANGTPMLILGRILFGLGAVGAFQIGAAYLGDITTPEQRPFAFGLYATAMGLGFTVGPIIGGQVSQRFGYESAYFVGTLIGLLGIVIAWRIFTRRSERSPDSAGDQMRSTTKKPSLGEGLRLVMRQRSLILVTFGNMLIGLTFAGAITTFFPVYGAELLISQAAIGTMFSVRAIVSTLGRIPNGIITKIFGNQAVMLAALFIETLVMLAISQTEDPTTLTLLLGVEGLAFGAFLVAGQTFVADNTTRETRGTAVGFYSMVSSIGRTLSPLGLGLIAARWGVASVFSVTGWILAVGFVLSLIGTILLGRHERAVEMADVG